jgi:pilus assembly protein Flp/PilA
VLRKHTLTTYAFSCSYPAFIAGINLVARARTYTVVHGFGLADNNGPGASFRQPRCGPMEPKKMNYLLKFLKDESGATAIEYGLIAAGISVAIIAVVQGVGSKLTSTFTSVQTALK